LRQHILGQWKNAPIEMTCAGTCTGTEVHRCTATTQSLTERNEEVRFIENKQHKKDACAAVAVTQALDGLSDPS
jgi:hypothetical protein